MEIDKGILGQIDKIQLSERFSTERERFFKHEPEVTADNAVLAMNGGRRQR